MPRVPLTRILINRNFSFLFGGQAISMVGDQVFMTALALWIATDVGRGQPWAPAAVSGIMLAWSLPIVVVGIVAGVFVDRWDKRHTMLAMDAIRSALIASLIPVSMLDLPILARLGSLYAAVFLVTVCSQFFNPSRTALIGDVVSQEQQAHASGLAQVSASLSIIVGPPLGALLLVHLGFQSVLAIEAFSFLASFVAILLVRPPHLQRAKVHAATGFLREFREGVQFFNRSRVLMTLLVTGVIIMLGMGALNALDVFFATQNLHASPAMYGLLSGAFGAGALAGAIVLSANAQRIGLTRIFSGGVLLVGVLLFLYSRLTAFAPGLVVLFLVGVVMVGPNIAVMPLILQETPRDMLGRVSSVLNPCMQTASIVSVVGAGFLVSSLLQGFHASILGGTFGPVDTVLASAGLLAIGGAMYSVVALRGRAGPDAAPEPTAKPSAIATP